LLLVAAQARAQQASSITVDQPPPYYIGDVVTVTSVYPQEARTGGRTPQFHFHPQCQITCSQSIDGVIYNVTSSADPEGQGYTNNGDGTYTGHSDPMTLLAHDPTLPASCSASVYNFIDKKGVVSFTLYAQIWFDAGPTP
jgi:hypothetical protein